MLLNLWEQIQWATPQALLSLGHCPPLSFPSHSNFWTIYVPFLPISLVPTHASTVCIPLILQEVILAKSLLTTLLAKYDWHTLVPLWTDPSIACDTTESSFLPETLLLPGDSVVPFYFDYLASPDYCFSAECTGTSSCTGPLQVGVSWGSRLYFLSLTLCLFPQLFCPLSWFAPPLYILATHPFSISSFHLHLQVWVSVFPGYYLCCTPTPTLNLLRYTRVKHTGWWVRLPGFELQRHHLPSLSRVV